MSPSVPPPGYQPPQTYAPPASDVSASDAKTRVGIRSKLTAAAVVLLAAVAVVYVAFGSASSQVTDPIAQAATLSSNAPGYQIDMRVAMRVPTLSEPIVAYGSGVIDPPDQSMSMSFSVDYSQVPQAAQMLGSTTMRMDLILDHRVMYLRLPELLANQNPSSDGKQWLKLDLGKMTGLPGMSSFGKSPMLSDPSHMLQYLRAASDSVTDLGQARVDGVETTRYRAMLNLDRLAADVPASARGTVQRALSQLEQSMGQHDFPVEVWIDGNDLVRRMVMSIALPVGDGQVMQETATADLSDYGPQPQPMPPPADQVQDLSSLIHSQG